MKRKAIYLAIPLALGLTACGGGGGGSTAASTPGIVSIMVTDAISTQFTKIWVTVQQVSVKDSAGKVTFLFDSIGNANTSARVFNLTELKGVSNLLNSKQLPAGTYSDLTIKMNPTVTLNKNAAASITATLDNPTVVIAGSFIVNGGKASVGIDFDLKNFKYTPPVAPATVGTISPSIVMRSHKTMQRLAQAFADVEGRIKSVSTANATDFVITRKNGTDIAVSLLGNATVLVENRGGTRKQVVRSNEALRGTDFIGKSIEVFGNYDSTRLTIDAVRVRVANESSEGKAFYGRDKVEGTATIKGNNLTIDVREASFIPDGNQISMDLKNSNPKYERGNLPDLQKATAPTQVEIRGNWDNTNSIFTPLSISIEGAQPDQSSNGGRNGNIKSDDPYVEVKGRVSGSPSTDVLTLNVFSKAQDEGDAIPLSTTTGGTIEVNFGKAWFKRGNSGCLKDGSVVELKGSFLKSTATLTARVIKLESACSFSGEAVNDIEVDNTRNDTGGDTGNETRDRPSRHPEVKGIIQSVDLTANNMVIKIFRARGIGSIPLDSTITVQFDTAKAKTLFDHGTSSDLKPGRIIGVNSASASDWSATSSTLTAGKIEFR